MRKLKCNYSKNPTNLISGVKKNKISKKRFSKLTGTSFKRLKKSKRLPKVVSLSCLALEMRKREDNKNKILKSAKKKK
jgi:hypothetical protein